MKTKGFCIIGVKESPEVGEESPEVRKSGRPEGNTSREVGELGSREVDNTSGDRKTGRQKDRKTGSLKENTDSCWERCPTLKGLNHRIPE